MVPVTRRQVLMAGAAVGGGLFVGLPLLATARAATDDNASILLRGAGAFNPWIRISPSGTVTVSVPRVEMGQGVYTALPLLAAEELEADWTKVRAETLSIAAVASNVQAYFRDLVFAATDADDGETLAAWANSETASALAVSLTGGSRSVRSTFASMRYVGAAAREMLIVAATRRWDVPRRECAAEKGEVIHRPSGERLGYGELAEEAARLAPPRRLALKPPERWTLVGKAAGRLDLREKVDGRALFGIDVRLPDMLYAAVRGSPVFGGKPKAVDKKITLSMPGVKEVVMLPTAVAVVADSTWRAQKGLEALAVQWDEGPHRTLSSSGIRERLEAALDRGDAEVFADKGDVIETLRRSANVAEAAYDVPYLAHACMEPINATARVRDDGCEIWVGSQGPNIVQDVAARLLGIEPHRVVVHTPYLGGGFGRRSEQDMIHQAVLVAQRTSPRPVKIFWDREEDIRHDMYRPAALCRLQAALDERGLPVAWHYRGVSQSPRASFMGRLNPAASSSRGDRSTVEGAEPLVYDVARVRVECAAVDIPVPVGWWRSVGHSQNAFFIESFIDELAHVAKTDPVAYRRALLKSKPRHRKVLETAAAKARWGAALPKGRARGVALHESFGSIVAQVAEVSLDNSGRVRVHRVTCAVDCGVVVEPDIVRAQMEGGIVFGLSAALYGEITLAEGRVEQGNFPDYEMVRLAEAPLIETHLVPSGDAPGGVGEPGVPPIAPAVANALCALTGKRLRSLPFAKYER